MSQQSVSGETAPGEGLPLSFDASIKLSARLLKRGETERGEILRQHQLAAEDWKKCNDHFMTLLADDISDGDGDLSSRYGAACVEELERRKREAKAPPAPPPPPAPASEPELPAVAAPEEVVPTYLVTPGGMNTAAQPPLQVKAPPAALAMTAGVPAYLVQAAAAAGPLPFGEQPSPDFLASLRAPTKPAARVGFGETLPLGAELPLPKGALPFASKAPEGPSHDVLVMLGVQGIGLSTPSFSAVAAFTAGLSMDEHIPNGRTLRVGTQSLMSAARFWVALTSGAVGPTPRGEGRLPLSQARTALSTASRGIVGPHGVGGEHRGRRRHRGACRWLRRERRAWGSGARRGEWASGRALRRPW